MSNAPLTLRKTAEAGCSLAAPDGRDGAAEVHQDAELSLAVLPEGEKLTYSLKPGRRAWLQVARGKTTLNGSALDGCDGASANDENMLAIQAVENAEILLFDLA